MVMKYRASWPYVKEERFYYRGSEAPSWIQEEETLLPKKQPTVAPNARAPAHKSQRRSLWKIVVPLGLVAAIFAGLIIAQSERISASTTKVKSLQNEIRLINASYDQKLTEFECAFDPATIQDVASRHLGMGYPTEDQIVLVDFSQPSSFTLILPDAAQGENQSEAADAVQSGDE